MDAKEIISSYFNKHLFAFLPNICNSACDFCYVQPLVGSASKLSKTLINNFDNLSFQAKNAGFDTIRITGGEPLIFSNFSSLLKILKANNLFYTLLTNGQKLSIFIDVLNFYLPTKITVSFHSIVNYATIFKNDIDIEQLFKTLNILKNKGVEICITSLYLPENFNEMPELLSFFERKKIDNIKIIYPNNTSLNLIDKFKSLSSNFNSSFKKFRITDFEQKKCMLKNRGFLSLIVEDLNAYNCCTNVGEEKNKTEIKDNKFNLEQILIKQYEDNLEINKFPCETNLDSCPIALKK
jgi:molybdenum cofactor biosynthesis enzyme MoaA